MTVLNEHHLTKVGIHTAGFIAEDWDDLVRQGTWVITDFPGNEDYEGWEIYDLVERESTVLDDPVILSFSLTRISCGRSQIHTLLLDPEQVMGVGLVDITIPEVLWPEVHVGEIWQTKSGKMLVDIVIVEEDDIEYQMESMPGIISTPRAVFHERFEKARPRPSYLVLIKEKSFDRWVSLEEHNAMIAIQMGHGDDMIRLNPDGTWKYVMD